MTRIREICFTSSDGYQATVIGDEPAIAAIERIFEQAGIKFNAAVSGWDQGYYDANGVPRK